MTDDISAVAMGQPTGQFALPPGGGVVDLQCCRRQITATGPLKEPTHNFLPRGGSIPFSGFVVELLLLNSKAYLAIGQEVMLPWGAR